MSLRTRRILYSFFILLFLTITPMVIFYAAGYKFTLSGKKLQKTGSFIFNTKPKGAKIYLNDKPQQTFFKKYFSQEKSFITTPAKIKNLLPDEYYIKFELDGYWPWQKKLEIFPGASTYAEDVYLFKKDLPLQLFQGKIDNLQISPDKNMLAILASDQLVVFDLNTEEQTLLVSDRLMASTTFTWAPSSKKILANQLVINIENINDKINLTDYLKTNINQFKWDAYSDDILYYQEANNILSFSLATKNYQYILKDQPYIASLVKNNNLYLIDQQDYNNNFNIFKLDSGELIKKINLPGSANYQFINPTHSMLNLYDQDHQILYLINPFSQFYLPLQETINNIKYTHWVKDDKLLYANDFEIWLLDLTNHKKTLLTRISHEINSILWHPSNNYIIYATDTTINTIELDEREKHNITEIIKLDKIAYTFLNPKGDTLYFYGQIGNQEGLYKLAIH